MEVAEEDLPPSSATPPASTGNLAANMLTIPAHQACLDFPFANFCGSVPFAWQKNDSLGKKKKPIEEQAAATQPADIICRSHSGRKKGGAHCAEPCPGPCEICRRVVGRLEEPWGGLQRPGMQSQELQNKPQKMVMAKHSRGRWTDVGKNVESHQC